MDKLACFSLILLIANEIFVTKADFFLDDTFGESSNRFDHRGVGTSVFSRNHNHYDRDSISSFDLGFSPVNKENDFDAQNRVDFFPGSQIHRQHIPRKHLQRNDKAIWDEKQGKYVVAPGSRRTEKWIQKRNEEEKKTKEAKKLEEEQRVTTPPPYEIRTRRPSRFFNVYRKFDDYNRYEKGDFWGKLPEDQP